jgi:Zn-dependent peptidase ImmA (M78 family)
LAHELGHFLADVFLIQQLWLKTLPEQKDTIERIFSWQEYDALLEFCGLIKGLPNRPKAIVRRGDALAHETAEREIQADLIARELLAPWDTVSFLFQPNERRKFIALLREQFGLPLKIAAYYYDDLERSL